MRNASRIVTRLSRGEERLDQIIRSGRLSDLIAQLQELLKGVDQVEIGSYKYDSALLAAQVFILCN
jgi:hypothetical protein